MNPLDQIMGVQEASELWGLSPGTIKNYCAERKVKCVQIGKTWILDKNQDSPAQPFHPKNWRGHAPGTTRGQQSGTRANGPGRNAPVKLPSESEDK